MIDLNKVILVKFCNWWDLTSVSITVAELDKSVLDRFRVVPIDLFNRYKEAQRCLVELGKDIEQCNGVYYGLVEKNNGASK